MVTRRGTDFDEGEAVDFAETALSHRTTTINEDSTDSRRIDPLPERQFETIVTGWSPQSSDGSSTLEGKSIRCKTLLRHGSSAKARSLLVSTSNRARAETVHGA